jgi:hypothetical protein
MRVSTDRLDLMDTVTVDGVQEKDPLTVQMRDFDARRNVGQHLAQQDEVPRPYLISDEQYGTDAFWWFILAVNAVVDPYDVPGDERLRVPSLDDYYDWFREQKGTT